MKTNDFLETLQDFVYDEQAFINILKEYCLYGSKVDETYVYRLLTHLSIINNNILDKIDNEIYS